jgi:predicted ATPase
MARFAGARDELVPASRAGSRSTVLCVVYLLSAELSDGSGESDGYPFGLPAVRALPDIEFAPVTVFVGDNGTGKSTLVEALAIAAGFNAEGGSRNLQFESYATHSALASSLRLRWSRRPRWGWFLRAETFYGMATHITLDDDVDDRGRPLGVAKLFPDLHHRSHGESFLTLIESRMRDDGLYLFDEPESALSFHGQLKLLGIMHDACAIGAQFVIATHSPMLMAYPGARIYEFDDDGAHAVLFDEVSLVGLWRTFLESPDRYFRHLFDESAD